MPELRAFQVDKGRPREEKRRMNRLMEVLGQAASTPSADVQAAADDMLKVLLDRGLTFKEARLAAGLVAAAVTHAAEHEAGDHLRQTPFAARGCEGH